MGNAALMLRSMGHEIIGADTGIYPPMSDLLLNSGIEIYEGYDSKRLEKLAPDLVVVGNVTTRGHVEMEWLLDTRALRYTSLPALLNEFVLSKRRNIVVAGTHGKTTTSTLTAYLLEKQGTLTPGYLIGGVPQNLPGGACAGVEGGPFVIEGDEYDSAFFDKRSKFIHYLPNVLALNNLEFDHADIFRDLEDIKRTFRHVMRLVPRNGFIVLNGEDKNLLSLLPVSWTRIHTVGTSPAGSFDLEIRNFAENADGASFTLFWKGVEWTVVKWKLHGIFNARNAAMAALSAGLLLYPENPTKLDLSSLCNFKGVKRRQEIIYSKGSLNVMEDFGHHPSAIRETLTAVRQREPDSFINVCFEPRSNTARLKVFEKDLIESFDLANAVFIGPIHRADKLIVEERLDPQAVCRAIEQRSASTTATTFASNEALVQSLITQTKSRLDRPQMTIFFTNGSFDGIMQKYCTAMEAGE